MSRTDPQLKFRVSQELRDRLEDAAKLNKRSLTAEITARLESTFREVTITEEELDAAFSGQSPFDEAVQARAEEVLALALRMAVQKLEADKTISKESADLVRSSSWVPGQERPKPTATEIPSLSNVHAPASETPKIRHRERSGGSLSQIKVPKPSSD